MTRKIISIDEEKCTGCGLCVTACHEGAIEMVDGKAKLVREHACDGLGDCLPACPAGAISFEAREAEPYMEAPLPCGCPGTEARSIAKVQPCSCQSEAASAESQLMQWPVQIRLIPPSAPYFQGSDLLIAADCTAYAYGSFHSSFMKGRITLVGCPKLDNTDYFEKLGAILSLNDIRSVTLARMEVPCCGGLEAAAKKAISISGKNIPLEVVTISTDGKILK